MRIFPGQLGNQIEGTSGISSAFADFSISRSAIIGNGCKPSELSEFGYFHDESCGGDGPNPWGHPELLRLLAQLPIGHDQIFYGGLDFGGPSRQIINLELDITPDFLDIDLPDTGFGLRYSTS